MGDFKSEYSDIFELSSKCLEEAHKITYGIFIKWIVWQIEDLSKILLLTSI